MSVELVRHRFTVARYDQMIAAGVFDEDERLELLGGEIIEMSPIGIKHAMCVNRINQVLTLRLGTRAIVSVQNPINLDRHSEPQPDVAVLQPREDFYAGGHPEPEDILLLIEVADSSLEYDRQMKLPRYAQAGIAEVWLADVEANVVTVYRQPTPQGYVWQQTYQRDEAWTLLAFPEVTVTAVDLLG